jgi:hypothetical protein
MRAILALTAALFLMLGCTREVVETRDVEIRIQPEISRQLIEKDLKIVRYPNGALRTAAFSALGTGARRMVHWSVHWFDASGKKISGTSDRWRRATVSDGSPIQLQASAPSRGAYRAEIFVRAYP